MKAQNKTDCSNDGCEEHSRLKPRVGVEVLMIRNCCQSSGWARAPFISIPDCEAKSCAHQSQVCKVTVNGVRKWQPRYKQDPVLYSSRISVETLVCLILGCHNYTSHYAAAASLFCREIYKISAHLCFQSLQNSLKLKICTNLFRNQIAQVITLVRISIYSRAADYFQFIMNSVTVTGDWTVELQTVGGDLILSYY